MGIECAGWCVAALLSANAISSDRQELPSEFVHDRFVLTPTVEGRTLRFFTDTGGGGNALSEDLAAKLSLPVKEIRADGKSIRVVPFPVFDAEASIPPPPPHFMGGRLMLAPIERIHERVEGFLGGRWFADRVWEFDYPAQRIALLGGKDDPKGTCVPLGFQKRQGKRTMHFPSIDLTVDGEVLPMLFDTGATAQATEVSAPIFGVKPGEGFGTSFIEHDVFERWLEAHPKWRVLENADQKGEQQRRMIEVPAVTIADHTVGTVWFAEQPPGSFQKYMSSMMDRPVWGALGGSALRYFRVVVDYPGSRACFFRASST